MKTYQLFVLFTIGCTFLSCSKSVYYAWSSSKGDYCTLEVKKYEAIYRASAFYCLLDDNIYIYIKDSRNKGFDIDNFSRRIYAINFNNIVETYRLSVSKSLENDPALSVKFLTEGFNLSDRDEDSRDLFYIKSENQDTIRLASFNVIKRNRHKNFSSVIDPLLLKEGIKYFPNEMYRVKRIDYKKFPKSIQKLKLKKPY